MWSVVWLDHADRAEPSAIGAHAARLAVLHQAGLPVARGFVVTTDGCRRSVGNAGAVISEIDDAYAALASRCGWYPAPVPVTVQPSWADLLAAEDPLITDQHLRFTNVRGIADVVRCVRECWAAASRRAAADEMAPRPDDVCGVLVQEAMPVTRGAIVHGPAVGDEASELVVVEAVLGMAEGIAGGVAEPDRYVVDASTGAVVSAEVSDQRSAVMPVLGGSGVRRAPLHHGAGERRAVTDDEASRLAGLGRAAAHALGAPCTLEVAIDAHGVATIIGAHPVIAPGVAHVSPTIPEVRS
jgi:pyruvate,water dikinase